MPIRLREGCVPVALLLQLAAACCRAELAADAKALISFRQEITNWGSFAPKSNVLGWSADGINPCGWSFVQCNSNSTRVIRLLLDGNALSETPQGTLSAALANLTALQTLSILNTQLSGLLHDAWAAPPAFSNLTVLTLVNNSISGVLPVSWASPSAFAALLTMTLDANRLEGTLPVQWAESKAWTNLNQLSVSRNSLTGSLPATWGSDPVGGLNSINNITLSFNQLTGTLPAWSNSGLAALAYLDLSFNQLTGTLVSEWSSVSGISRLQTLMLQNNELSGPLPSAWADRNQFTALTTLDLSGNMISGSFPATWLRAGAMQALSRLVMNNNPITGSLPAEFANASVMQSLSSLSLVNTSIRGPLPDAWAGHFNQAGMSALSELYLGFNDGLAGFRLPVAWGNGSWPALRILSVPYSGLHGPLPVTYGANTAFPQLASIELTGNYLTGTLPPAWGNDSSFDFLRLLLLGDNLLGGSLPSQWGGASAFPVLRQLDLSGNQLTDGIPDDWSVFQISISIWVQPGNAGLCGQPPSSFFCSLPSNCTPTSADVNAPSATCTCNSFQAPPCPPDTPNSMPASSLRSDAKGLNASLELTGIDPAGWTVARSSILVVVLIELIGIPQLGTSDFNVTRVYTTGQPASRRLLHDLGLHVHNAEHRRSLLQSSSTIVQLVINTENPSQFGQIQSQLRNMTASADNGTLVGALLSTGQYSGLSAVSLQSVDPVQPMNGPAAPSPGDLPRPSLSKAGMIGSVVAGIILIIALTLLVTWISYKIHKRRKRRKAALKEQPSLGFLTSSPLMSGHSHGSQNQNGKGVHSGVLELEAMPSRDLQLAFSDWLVNPEEIEICKRADGSNWELGAGGFGRVYKAMRSGVTVVAVKVMGETQAGQMQANKVMQQTELFEREILLLKSCRDRNIVQFLGACMQPGKLMLITEYLERGDLCSALEKDRSDPRQFTWWKPAVGEGRKIAGLNKRIALDLARGLAFLHQRKIVHRDIKPQNILLARDMTAKLADVGLAKVLRSGYLSTLQGQLGTFAWAAPEILLGRECSEKVDIYSFGVCLWQLSTGDQPEGRFLRPLSVADDCPPAVERYLRLCLSEEPHLRPSAVDIVHWLTELG